MKVQWYPGHMAKAKRQVRESLRLVDVVIEILDARIPVSSSNPDMRGILDTKLRIVVLNKSDLANPLLTALWLKRFSVEKVPAVEVDSVSGRGVKDIPTFVRRLVREKGPARTRGRLPRCLVVGIPNVGKSFFINCLVGRKAARTGDHPGVTRGQQWIRLDDNMELLDTPGILWPKLDDGEVAFKLAVTGAIKEDVFNVEEAAANLIEYILKHHPGLLKQRYGICETEDKLTLLELIGQKRGMLVSGGVVDLSKASVHLLKEFREGKIGRITLDLPADRQLKNFSH